MFIPAISSQRPLHQMPTTSSINWNEFDIRNGTVSTSIIEGTAGVKLLHGTQLSCTICSEAGQWKNRQIFMEKVIQDIIANCPKNEPLVFISLGADRLLTEFILGKSLIQNGFRQLSFLLVDPVYVFTNQDNLKVIKEVLKDFRDKITSAYLNTYQEHFPQESIRYLSRSQNIAKYFPSNANVVVIESLPPFAEIIKDIQKVKAMEKKPEDLLAGGHLTQSSHANAVAFIPSGILEVLNNSDALLSASLPLPFFKSAQSLFYIDWGCKIQSDGTYSLSFTGEDYYIESLETSKDRVIPLTTGELVQVGEWIPFIRNTINKTLYTEIKSLTSNDLEKKLSQENLTFLLEKVKEIFTKYMPGGSCFFSVDYTLDRNAAMAFIASHASHHYRKTFSLTADLRENYKISVNDIN